jgi:hypothetical protein
MINIIITAIITFLLDMNAVTVFQREDEVPGRLVTEALSIAFFLNGKLQCLIWNNVNAIPRLPIPSIGPFSRSIRSCPSYRHGVAGPEIDMLDAVIFSRSNQILPHQFV